MLDVGDGHRVAWSIAGNPDGKPAIVLHGGPGKRLLARLSTLVRSAALSGRADRSARLAVGARRTRASRTSISRPTRRTTSSPTSSDSASTSRIDRWLVWGGSWGTTLGLAYAETHPDRVTEMILVSVVTTTAARGRVGDPGDGPHLPRGVGALPRRRAAGRARRKPRRGLRPPAARPRPGGARARGAAVVRVGGHPRRHAIRATSTTTATTTPASGSRFARLVTHYWSNAAFLEDGVLMRDAERLVGIPGVLIHGRLDISGPPDIAWRLAERWPSAELVLIGGAGHGASDDDGRGGDRRRDEPLRRLSLTLTSRHLGRGHGGLGHRLPQRRPHAVGVSRRQVVRGHDAFDHVGHHRRPRPISQPDRDDRPARMAPQRAVDRVEPWRAAEARGDEDRACEPRRRACAPRR